MSSPIKVAFVDDNADFRKLTAINLTRLGYQCDTFNTAQECLAAVNPGGHDVLILDIRLHAMNGIELLKQLRRRAVHTPAIVITGFNNVDYAREALNAGASYLLEKPFSGSQLHKVIQKLLVSPRSLQDCVDRGLATLSLARREEEIARLMLKGLSNKEIAEFAGISEATVKQYVVQLFDKARVASRGEFFATIFPT